MSTTHGDRCRVLPDPDGEVVIFHGPTEAMDSEWLQCEAGLLKEVER
jgi:hypothetical protein